MGQMMTKRLNARAAAMAVMLAVAVALAGLFAVAPQVAYASDGVEAGGSLVTAQSGLAPEAAKKTLASKGVKFDLKNNKVVYTYMPLRGAGKVLYAVKVSDYKLTTLKNGRKKATFTTTWQLNSRLSKAQINAVLKRLEKGDYWNNMTSYQFTHFVDYATGENLEDASANHGVKIAKKTLKETPTKTCTSASGAWFRLSKLSKHKWAVTFPADYENLAVGVGHGVYYNSIMPAADQEFEWNEGSGRTYYETSWFKKGKDNFHFMRIR